MTWKHVNSINGTFIHEDWLFQSNFSWNDAQSQGLPEYRVDSDDVGNGHEEEDEEEEEGGAVHPHSHHPGPPEKWILH